MEEIFIKYFKKIDNKYLYLSPINIDDAEQFTEWVNNLDLTVNLSMAPCIFTIEKEKQLLENLCKEGYHFSIVKLKNDELIGICGLLSVDKINRTAEAGIFI